LILDGIHRRHAFKECGFKKIATVEWKEKPLDYETSQSALLLEASECNTKHGDRLWACARITWQNWRSDLR
jgi:hypothetical protein